MSEEVIKDTLLEARILEKLDHPNIIHFKESFIMKKPKLSLCIVMDYADG
jgi:NIMA (never in mitosis gene a)-related kinase